MKKSLIAMLALAVSLVLVNSVSAIGLAGSTFGVGPGTLSGSVIGHVTGPNPVSASGLPNAVPGTSYWNYYDESSGRTFFYAYNQNYDAYFYSGGGTGYFENGGITPEGFMSSGIRGMSNGMGGSFGNGAGAF